MADAPTAEEVQQSKNEAQEAHWQGDFKEEDLQVPYSRDEETADETDNKETDTETPTDETAIEDEQYSDPAPAITLADPGAYEPADYSFDIEIDGKTIKIDTFEKAEQIGEDYADKLTAKQLFSLISKSSKIERNQERDREAYDTKKKAYDEQVATQAERMEVVSSIESEINYLVSKGRIPAADAEYLNADWSNPEVAKQPGIKEQLALLNYMNKENAIRQKAGIKPFGPVDAFTAMQNDESEKARIQAAKTAGESRKAAGSKVSGVGAPQAAPYVPKGIAVGRTGVFNRGAAMWD